MTTCKLCRGACVIRPCRLGCHACAPYRVSDNPEHDGPDIECPDCAGRGSLCECGDPDCDAEEFAELDAQLEEACEEYRRHRLAAAVGVS